MHDGGLVSWTQTLREQSRPKPLTCPLCRAVLEPAGTLKIYMGNRRERHAPRILCACHKAPECDGFSGQFRGEWYGRRGNKCMPIRHSECVLVCSRFVEAMEHQTK